MASSRLIAARPARPEAGGIWRIGGTGSRSFVLLLLAVRAVVALVTVEVARTQPMRDTDILRFEQIATEQGRPYVDAPVEYAPVETLAIEVLGGDGAGATASRITLLWLACEIAVVLALRWGWGLREAGAYLLLGLPIVPLMSLRLDPLAIALAAWGAALTRRGRQELGGGLIGLAILTKVWPMVLLPALWLTGRLRALVVAAGVALAGAAAWVTWAGVDAPRQVGLFRGATGWHIQSTVGAAVWIVTGGPLRYERNAERVGLVPGWARLALLVATMALIVATWAVARRRTDRDRLGLPVVASLGALIALSPVFSAQYVAWLLPWAAIAAVEAGTRSLVRTTMAISALAGLTYAVFGVGGGATSGGHIPVLQALLLATGGLTLALPVRWLTDRAPAA